MFPSELKGLRVAERWDNIPRVRVSSGVSVRFAYDVTRYGFCGACKNEARKGCFKTFRRLKRNTLSSRSQCCCGKCLKNNKLPVEEADKINYPSIKQSVV